MAQYIVSFPGLGLEQIPVRRIAFPLRSGRFRFKSIGMALLLL